MADFDSDDSVELEDFSSDEFDQESESSTDSSCSSIEVLDAAPADTNPPDFQRKGDDEKSNELGNEWCFDSSPEPTTETALIETQLAVYETNNSNNVSTQSQPSDTVTDVNLINNQVNAVVHASDNSIAVSAAVATSSKPQSSGLDLRAFSMFPTAEVIHNLTKRKNEFTEVPELSTLTNSKDVYESVGDKLHQQNVEKTNEQLQALTISDSSKPPASSSNTVQPSTDKWIYPNLPELKAARLNLIKTFAETKKLSTLSELLQLNDKITAIQGCDDIQRLQIPATVELPCSSTNQLYKQKASTESPTAACIIGVINDMNARFAYEQKVLLTGVEPHECPYTKILKLKTAAQTHQEILELFLHFAGIQNPLIEVEKAKESCKKLYDAMPEAVKEASSFLACPFGEYFTGDPVDQILPSESAEVATLPKSMPLLCVKDSQQTQSTTTTTAQSISKFSVEPGPCFNIAPSTTASSAEASDSKIKAAYNHMKECEKAFALLNEAKCRGMAFPEFLQPHFEKRCKDVEADLQAATKRYEMLKKDSVEEEEKQSTLTSMEDLKIADKKSKEEEKRSPTNSTKDESKMLPAKLLSETHERMKDCEKVYEHLKTSEAKFKADHGHNAGLMGHFESRMKRAEENLKEAKIQYENEQRRQKLETSNSSAAYNEMKKSEKVYADLMDAKSLKNPEEFDQNHEAQIQEAKVSVKNAKEMYEETLKLGEALCSAPPPSDNYANFSRFRDIHPDTATIQLNSNVGGYKHISFIDSTPESNALPKPSYHNHSPPKMMLGVPPRNPSYYHNQTGYVRDRSDLEAAAEILSEMQKENQEEIAKLRTELRDLKQTLKDTENSRNTLIEINETLKAEKEWLQNNGNTVRKMEIALKDANKEYQKVSEEKDSKIAKLESNLEKQEKTAEKHLNTISDQFDEISRLKRRLSQIQPASITDLEKELEVEQAKYDAIKNTFDLTNPGHNKMIMESAAKVAKLRAALLRKDNGLTTSQVEVIVQEKVREKNEEIEKMKEFYEKQNSELSKMIEEIKKENRKIVVAKDLEITRLSKENLVLKKTSSSSSKSSRMVNLGVQTVVLETGMPHLLFPNKHLPVLMNDEKESSKPSQMMNLGVQTGIVEKQMPSVELKYEKLFLPVLTKVEKESSTPSQMMDCGVQTRIVETNMPQLKFTNKYLPVLTNFEKEQKQISELINNATTKACEIQAEINQKSEIISKNVYGNSQKQEQPEALRFRLNLNKKGYCQRNGLPDDDKKSDLPKAVKETKTVQANDKMCDEIPERHKNIIFDEKFNAELLANFSDEPILPTELSKSQELEKPKKVSNQNDATLTHLPSEIPQIKDETAKTSNKMIEYFANFEIVKNYVKQHQKDSEQIPSTKLNKCFPDAKAVEASKEAGLTSAETCISIDEMLLQLQEIQDSIQSEKKFEQKRKEVVADENMSASIKDLKIGDTKSKTESEQKLSEELEKAQEQIKYYQKLAADQAEALKNFNLAKSLEKQLSEATQKADKALKDLRKREAMDSVSRDLVLKRFKEDDDDHSPVF